MHVLTLNAGSGTLKAASFADPGGAVGDPPPPDWARTLAATSGQHGVATRELLGDLDRPVDVVVHRVVHGGTAVREPARLTDEVRRALEEAAPLAPLHARPALDVIDEATAALPRTPAVVVPDTAFHRDLPAAAATFPGPHRWRDLGYVRFGFHGVAHEYAAHRAAHHLGRPVGEVNVVSCHLGGGCSLAAIEGGRSVDTTMGFTPLDGLPMATRSGAIDPGLLLHLLESGTTVAELSHLLQRASGLLGLSGVSADLSAVVEAADRGDERAALAVDVYLHRLRSTLASMLVQLDPLDAVTLSGGVGEHVPRVAEAVRAALDRFDLEVPMFIEAAREDWVLALTGAREVARVPA